jgi:hypothetical protein
VKKSMLFSLIVITSILLNACGGMEGNLNNGPEAIQEADTGPAPDPESASTKETPEHVVASTPAAPALPTQQDPAISVVQAQAYLDEGEAISIFCPVPKEFCGQGVELFNEDGSYLGLGFDLPEGTPIFAVGDGQLFFHGWAARYWFDESPSYIFYFNLRARQISYGYMYSGHSRVFPNPRTVDGEAVFPDVSRGSITVNGGQELGRVVSKWADQGLTSDGSWFRANLIITVEGSRLRLTAEAAPVAAAEEVQAPELKPSLIVTLPDGSEASFACPVPEEFCEEGMALLRDDGSFYGLGFFLPEGTPILAVAEGTIGKTQSGWWNDVALCYSGYELTAEGIAFSYYHTGQATPTPSPTVPGQELGRTGNYGFDKCVGYGCNPALNGFNFILTANERCSQGWGCKTLQIDSHRNR